LHHAAVEHFDIGIYFEANGHGTVVFSKRYELFATTCRDIYNDPFYIHIHQLINPAVGDALCDMLLVDYLLQSMGDDHPSQQPYDQTLPPTTEEDDNNNRTGWTLERWNNEFYHDIPSRMLKVKVANRALIRCNDNETICLEPTIVQPLLQTAMDQYVAGRTFVRPSGTEDIVRVYAEASTRDQADALAIQAAQIVYDTCQGVGERPET
jgi:phosphoacetylglucosamine mutase